MLGVCLLILKIIGIVLLALLLLLLLVLGLLLFVPVRYKIYASYYNELKFSASLTWLLRLLRINAKFDKEFSYEGKIAFFKFLDGTSEEDVSKEEENSTVKDASGKASSAKAKKEKNVFDDDFEDDEPNENAGKAGEEEQSSTGVKTEHFDEFYNEEFREGELGPEPDIDESRKTDDFGEDDFEDEDLDEEDLADKDLDYLLSRGPIGKVRRILIILVRKLKRILSLIADSLRKVKGAKEKLFKKINHIKELVTDEENKEFLAFIIQRLKELLKLLKPKKYKIDLHFGFEDPSTTGKILMYLSVIYGLTGLDMKINPDFEEEVKEGEILLKGSFQLIFLVIIAVKLFLNKKFKELVFK
ncbi:DUF2953 domain-containing protein [Lachnospira pectinoschiza]|uniref:DUF2953 domain-containing protein n=1 Tax=Lachnospira pectinoschiza TaxID=28052 RepID=A0A1G9VC78_9FIRM|nr:DUF2953 domain-containing protein [Lachnospira pectinoschiza]SDM69759.1 Protein of unknown function [Lachnospira pectinoschiza]